MRLSAPKFIVFVISVVLIVFGLVSWLAFNPGQALYGLSTVITFVGGALLSLGCLLKGL